MMFVLKRNLIILSLFIACIFVFITCTETTSCATEKTAECYCQFSAFTYAQDEVLPNRTLDNVYEGFVCHFSSLNLTKFPSIGDDVANKLVCLDLSGNDLTSTVGWNLSRFLNLRYLDITGNPIVNVAPDTFIGLPNTRELRISPNLATQDNFPVDNGVGGESNTIMGSLTRLVITGTTTTTTTTMKPITIFMDSLEELRISSITVDKFPARFVENYTRLASISLTDIKMTGGLNVETFWNLPKLYHFKWTKSDMSQSYNDRIKWATFIKYARNLKIVDLSQNLLGNIQDLLANEREPLELERLDLSHNCIPELKLSNINIVNMDLSSSSCPPRFLGSYKNVWIQNLDVSNSSIKELPKYPKFYKFENNDRGLPPYKYNGRPQTINISNNPIEEAFRPNIFENFRYLKVLDLTGNDVKMPCDCRLQIPLVALSRVVVKGTCLGKNNERLSIENEVRKSSPELLRTTACNYCPATPCLYDGVCDHACVQWENGICVRRQTQCTCKPGFSGVLCQSPPATTTSSNKTATNTTVTSEQQLLATIDELRELKKKVDESEENLKIAILFIAIVGLLTFIALCGVVILYRKTIVLIADHNSTSKTM